MKKRIWAIAAGVMVAGAITFIACGKDNTDFENDETRISALKGSSKVDDLRNAMHDFYQACDKAYKHDPESFLAICAANDYENFLNVVNVDVSHYEKCVDLFYAECFDDELDAKGDENVDVTSLAEIGAMVESTDGHSVLFTPSLENNQSIKRVANIIDECKDALSAFQLIADISASIGTHVPTFTIAKVKDGSNEPELLFDTDELQEKLESLIAEVTSPEDFLVVEDVRVIMKEQGDTDVFPLLKVSFFEGTKGVGYSTFFMLSASHLPGGSALSVNLHEINTTCVSNHCKRNCIVEIDKRTNQISRCDCPTTDPENGEFGTCKINVTQNFFPCLAMAAFERIRW